MTPFRCLVTVLAVAVAALPGGQAAGKTPVAAKIHVIVIDAMRFGAPPAGLRVGDTIEWVNRDLFDHTVTARDKSFNVILPSNTKRRMVLRRAGSFAFYCIYHPGMRGRLVVRQ